MPALFAIICPHCKKQGKGPIELNGQKVRCRSCGRVFLVQLAKKSAAASPAPAASSTSGGGRGAAAAKAKGSSPAAQVKPRPPQPPPHPEPQGPGTYAFAGDSAASTTKGIPPVAELEVSALDDEESNPYGMKDVDLARRCPFCAEELDEEDIVCVNCGYNTQTRQHHQTVRTYANTSGEVFMWILPGVLCVIGVFALIGLGVFYWIGLESSWWKDVDGWGVPNLSYGFRVWGEVLLLFLIYLQAKFAFKRLILHPTPPEMEKT